MLRTRFARLSVPFCLFTYLLLFCVAFFICLLRFLLLSFCFYHRLYIVYTILYIWSAGSQKELHPFLWSWFLFYALKYTFPVTSYLADTSTNLNFFKKSKIWHLKTVRFEKALHPHKKHKFMKNIFADLILFFKRGLILVYHTSIISQSIIPNWHR